MLLVILVVFLLALALYSESQNQSVLPYSFALVFAGSNFGNACSQIGQSLTVYSSSASIQSGTILFANADGSVPVQDGWYGWSEGSRIGVTGGSGQVDQIVGCA